MRAGMGLSRHPDPERACVDAAEHAMMQAGGRGDPDLLICVAVGHSAQEALVGLELAQRLSGAREALAVTATSVHVSPAPVEADHGCAVGALVLYGNPALTVVNNRMRVPEETGRPMALFLEPTAPLRSLLNQQMPLLDPSRAAGVSATTLEGEAGIIHHGHGRVDLAALIPNMPACEVAMASGVIPVGTPMQVTRVDGTLVLELDHRPALDRVLEQLPLRARQEPARALARCMVGLTPQGVRLPDMDNPPLMERPLVGLAQNMGALAVGDAPATGTWLQLVRKDPDHAERALQRALLDVKFRLRGSAPLCALYFTCVERGKSMFGRQHVEIQRLARALGRVPVLGMSGAVQVGPQAGQLDMHMLSGVLMVLAQGN